MKFRALFWGRKVGALGVRQLIRTETEGEDEAAAFLALYDRYEHIAHATLREVPDK